jgi:hypothetical protein
MGNDNNSRELAYQVTNESLEAIVKGLNIQPEDSVLSVCGSGDQAFAILEKANNIVVVDSFPKQINYFVKRKNLLKAGEFEGVLTPEEMLTDKRDLQHLKLRNEYFSEGRLKRIQDKLKDSERIRKITGSLFDLTFAENEFNKIYLSNILTYSLKPKTIELAQGRLKTIAGWLSDKGLIYLSDYNFIIRRGIYESEKSFLEPSGLIVNPELTAEAQRLQEKARYWINLEPVVLQKVA